MKYLFIILFSFLFSLSIMAPSFANEGCPVKEEVKKVTKHKKHSKPCKRVIYVEKQVAVPYVTEKVYTSEAPFISLPTPTPFYYTPNYDYMNCRRC